MGFAETLVKVIFWARVRRAKQIGEAAELISQGRAEETLSRLATMERRIPPYLGHMFFLTRGRALDALERPEEAEQAYLAAVFAKEGATIAYVHLAVLCGRQRRFQEARDWLRRIGEDKEAEESLCRQAEELEAMLDDVESGRRLEELRQRARRFADDHDLADLPPGVATLGALDSWIDEHQAQAEAECDELACFLGEQLVLGLGGEWRVSLGLEDSYIDFGDAEAHPFTEVGARLRGERRLEELLER